VASLLEEISREERTGGGTGGAGEIGVDPELDEFMVCSPMDHCPKTTQR
jgi:hypothetical protein